jgi:peptidyl-prolyl cis-trans isomerase B (cyclophilin B)
MAGQVSYPPPPPQYPVVMMPAGYVPAAKTNGMAIAALVCSLVISPLGIVFGHIALSQIKRTGEDGRGLAIAGLVIGYICTAILVVYLIFVIAFLGALGAAINDSTYDSDYYSMAATSTAG